MASQMQHASSFTSDTILFSELFLLETFFFLVVTFSGSFFSFLSMFSLHLLDEALACIAFFNACFTGVSVRILVDPLPSTGGFSKSSFLKWSDVGGSDNFFQVG